MSNIVYDNPYVAIRSLAADDAARVQVFASDVPAHDLLFLARDIRNERVVSAWIRAAGTGAVKSLIAFADDRIVAATAVLRDPLGWSAHVAEVRLLVAPEWRGKGLGRALLEACIASAAADGAAKLVAHMTPDQRGAITLFEEHGFRAEALLRDHVRDAAGELHDLVLLSLDFARAEAAAAAFR